MQIGRLLLERGWVEPDALARGLVEQRLAGARICSLLIARGQLDPDHAARALAEQHGVAGVLQRHFEHRDRTLTPRLRASVAHACMALPIGRTRAGELVVCVRDPSDAIRATLAAAIAEPIVIAVAPARQLEQLVRHVYDPSLPDGAPERHEEFEVDLTTQPIDLPDALPDALTDTNGDAAALARLGDLGSMTLVGLDDIGVAKDPSQAGQAPALPRKPG